MDKARPDVEAHVAKPAEPANGSRVPWKWITAILATAMLAGIPPYIYSYLNVPTNTEIEKIRDRQLEILERVGSLETVDQFAARDRVELSQRIARLERER